MKSGPSLKEYQQISISISVILALIKRYAGEQYAEKELERTLNEISKLFQNILALQDKLELTRKELRKDIITTLDDVTGSFGMLLFPYIGKFKSNPVEHAKRAKHWVEPLLKLMLIVEKILRKHVKKTKKEDSTKSAVTFACNFLDIIATVIDFAEDHELNFRIHLQMMEWAKLRKNNPVKIYIPGNRVDYELQPEQYKQFYKAHLLLYSYKYYSQKGYLKKSIPFLEKALNLAPILMMKVVCEYSCLIKWLSVNPSESKVRRAFFLNSTLIKYISNLDKSNLEDFGLEYCEKKLNEHKKLHANIQERLIMLYALELSNTPLKYITFHLNFKDNCLMVKWDMGDHLSPSNFRPNSWVFTGHSLKISGLMGMDSKILVKNLLEIENQIEMKRLSSRLALNLSLSSPASQLVKLAEPERPCIKFETIQQIENLQTPQISMSQSMRKERKKIKKKAHSDKKKTLKNTPQRQEHSSEGFSAKKLGFVDEDKTDFKVYEIYGHGVPRGIHYSSSICIGKTDTVSHLLPLYQDTLERGKIASRHKKGLRFVYPQESGLDYTTFKIAVPNQNLRILLHRTCTKKRNGKEIYLYSPDTPVRHKTKK